MISWQTLILWLHIAGASVWVAGSLVLGVTAVLLAGKGRSADPRVGDRISSVGRAFGWVLWPALAATIGTGVANFSSLFPAGTDWLGGPAGPWFLAKFVAVGIIVVSAGTHSFLVGTRIRRLRARGTSEASLRGLRMWAGGLGALSVVASLAAVLLAVVAGTL